MAPSLRPPKSTKQVSSASWITRPRTFDPTEGVSASRALSNSASIRANSSVPLGSSSSRGSLSEFIWQLLLELYVTSHRHGEPPASSGTAASRRAPDYRIPDRMPWGFWSREPAVRCQDATYRRVIQLRASPNSLNVTHPDVDPGSGDGHVPRDSPRSHGVEGFHAVQENIEIQRDTEIEQCLGLALHLLGAQSGELVRSAGGASERLAWRGEQPANPKWNPFIANQLEPSSPPAGSRDPEEWEGQAGGLSEPSGPSTLTDPSPGRCRRGRRVIAPTCVSPGSRRCRCPPGAPCSARASRR